MNFKKITKLIQKDWSHLDLKYETLDDRLKMSGSIVGEGIKDDIFLESNVYKDGRFTIEVVFDSIIPTYKTYELINDFNQCVGYLKAYIDERNNTKYLTIEYFVLNTITEANASESFGFALYKIISDETMKYLKPILEFTE